MSQARFSAQTQYLGAPQAGMEDTFSCWCCLLSLQVIAFSSVSDKRLELSTLSYAYECMATRIERIRF